MCDASIAGEKTGFAAASAFSFRCTDCTAGATCNKWRADLIAEKRFIFNHTKTPVVHIFNEIFCDNFDSISQVMIDGGILVQDS